jgi:hypothetical protein
MLAKNFGKLMKNDIFKKKFTGRLKKVPKEAESEEVGKKDLRGPKCFECSGYWHVKVDCRNLKQAKGKAYNATLSDESEEEEALEKDQKFLAIITPHEDSEGSQSYYSESSDDREELMEAYKILYVKLSKLRETRQQHVLELNSLKTEKSTMLFKITDLEEKLLEAQLQIESITNERLTQMLSVQKCPTDKRQDSSMLPLLLMFPLKLYLLSPQSPSLHSPVWTRERLSLMEKIQLLRSLLQK